MASVDRDGSELLASQRWQREAAARARQTAMVQAETAAQLRRDAAASLETAAQLRQDAAALLETAAELCAQALKLRAQLDKERDATGEKRRIAYQGRVASQELPTPGPTPGRSSAESRQHISGRGVASRNNRHTPRADQ